MKDTWTLRHLPASLGPIPNSYTKVMDVVQNLHTYRPASLLDLEPEDRYERRQWLEKLSLPFPATLYSYHHGNSLGNKLPMAAIWRER